MIPVLLQAHTRALTKVLYNSSGDLLFSSAKDSRPCVWYTHNGERLGTFNGHQGSIWSIDVNRDSTRFYTASGDMTSRAWDVETGKEVWKIETRTGSRGISVLEDVDGTSNSGLVAVITDATMGHIPQLLILDTRIASKGDNAKPIICSVDLQAGGAKPTVVTVGNGELFLGHENGKLAKWTLVEMIKGTDSEIFSNPCLESPAIHTDAIRDVQWSLDKTYFITASRDMSSKLVSAADLSPLKTYKMDRPVNSASISPLRGEVVIAGGQEAGQVTQTGSGAGQFEARFYDQVQECEVGRVKGHFGPIHTLQYHPTGRGYASGAEDGYVRMHQFDPDYFDFTYDE